VRYFIPRDATRVLFLLTSSGSVQKVLMNEAEERIKSSLGTHNREPNHVWRCALAHLGSCFGANLSCAR
jgi:hypothetical protein